ncbi:RNA polymerase sigma factor SigX [Anoxybacillus sp. J5B_2022]|uniref:RNA polymerase sigma factor SigX n=1 Tax=Anoxybacillus sp. J5B_2022 TaxID=3003246 RepID=UPI0022857A36|nr:RNA polymerase sigma factor SigX [Anoxybacillus sp. J5B_2022]MCZ0754542.1 RNA polymerase sigma factor SigX [Anoxybacillus sp. J5B_2022]
MDSIFDELYEKYHQDLFQFLFYMVRNREQAEDLVQEVYMKVLRSYDRFEGRSSEKTWLLSIAKHVAIDFFRKQRSWRYKIMKTFDWTVQPLHDPSPLPEEIAVQNEEIQLMYRCLGGCTIDQRLVVVLRFIQGLSVAETAEALGWTESKVKTTQHRALKRLRQQMEEEAAKGGWHHEKIPME